MSELPTKNLWERLNNSALIRFLLLFASGWALVQILEYFEGVIVIFSFAAIIAFLLSYPVGFLKRFFPHGVSVTLVFLFSLILLGAFTITVGLSILSQGQQLIDSVTDFLSSLTPLVEQIERYLRSRNLQVNLGAIEEALRSQALAVLAASIATSTILLTNLVNFILIEVIAFFMLLDGEQVWNFLLKVIPRDKRDRFAFVVRNNFLNFFRGQLLLTAFLSASTFLVFVVLGVPFPLVLAAIAGVFDLIPGIGATLGVALICLILLPQSVWLALKVLVACIVLQQIQDNLLAPRVMQNSLNLNPVVVFFALLMGAQVAGILGIFLAIPLAGVVVTFFEIEDMKAASSE